MWTKFCDRKGYEPYPVVPILAHISEFLTSRHEEGIGHSQLNKYKSALSRYMPEVERYTVGTHPIIEKLMKAFYRKDPPRPRYSSTWDIDQVLSFWKSSKSNESLSLYELGMKTFTLLSIHTMGRSADIRNLSAKNYHIEKNVTGEVRYVELLLITLPKQQRAGPLRPVRIHALEVGPDHNICPARTCVAYLDRTNNLRPEREQQLMIRSTKPYTGIKAMTATRWILYSMGKGGVDTTKFKAHSICGASASGKVGAGMAVGELLAGGRWSCESTIRKFYLRDTF